MPTQPAADEESAAVSAAASGQEVEMRDYIRLDEGEAELVLFVAEGFGLASIAQRLGEPEVRVRERVEALVARVKAVFG